MAKQDQPIEVMLPDGYLLACGHVVRRKYVRPSAKVARCDKCPKQWTITRITDAQLLGALPGTYEEIAGRLHALGLTSTKNNLRGRLRRLGCVRRCRRVEDKQAWGGAKWLREWHREDE